MIFTSIIQTQRSILNLAVATLLIAVAIFVPSTSLVKMLRTDHPPTDLLEQLRTGAMLFRIGLIVLGVFIITIVPLFTKQTKAYSKVNTNDSHFKHNLVWVTLILLTAILLRVYQLDMGLWLDEILTYVNYAKMSFGDVLTTYDSQNQHFLYSLLAHASFLIFGEANWSLRLPAVIFGVASIWALYLLGRQVASNREALLASLLFTFSYHHIWFSQNARGYSGLLFWTIFASWLFLRALRDDLSGLWVSYAVSAALGVYTHMTMIFVVLGHFIIYAASLYNRRNEIWPEKWGGLVIGFCLAGFLTYQLHAFVLPQTLMGLGEESTVVLWKNPLWTLLEFGRGIRIGFTGSIAGLGAFLLLIAGVFGFLQQKPVVIALLVLPTFIGSVAIFTMDHHIWPRFYFFAVGFGVLVVVRGTTILGQKIASFLRLSGEGAFHIGTVLCSLIILASIISIPKVYAPKQDYKGALSFVEEYKEPDTAVVTVGLTRFPYTRYYQTGWEEIKTADQLNSIRFRHKKTLLLYTLPQHLKSTYPDIMKIIEHDFKVLKRFYGTLNGGTIFVCVSEASN